MIKIKKSKISNIYVISIILVLCTVFIFLWLNRQIVFSKVSGLFVKPVDATEDFTTPPPSNIDEQRYTSESEFLSTFKIMPLAANFSFKAMKINIGEGRDFPSANAKTAADQQAEMNSILDFALNNGMNTVVIDGAPFLDSIYPSNYLKYSSTLSGTQGTDPGYDLLKYISETAKSKSLNVIITINPLLICQNGANAGNHISPYPELTVALSDGSVYYNPGLPEVRDLIINVASEIVTNYDIYGIILDNPSYPSKEFDDASTYKNFGKDLSLEDFRRRNIDLIVSQTVSRIKTIKPDVMVGASVYGVWGTAPDKPDGVALTSPVSSYSDYYQDSLKWIKSVWLDFITPKLEWSIENQTLPFTPLATWWTSSVKDTGVQMYITHAAYKTSSSEEGWGAIDQLSKQYDTARALSGYSGSIFDSYSSLAANPNSTSALTMLFKGLLDFTTLNNNLTITEPKNKTVTDNETIAIRGICDNNFPLFLNGEQIQPTSKGLFAVDVKLKPGTNTYKLEHKGVTQTITITYSIVVLKEISPTTEISASGGAQIAVFAIAHKGATVKSTFNGQTITLEEQQASGEEDDELINSDFARFIGSFTLPPSTTSVQNLGTASITASFKGFSKTMKTKQIKVNAVLPTPSPTPVPTPPPSPTTAPTADPTPTPGPVLGASHIIEITNTYTQTYDLSVAGDNSIPTVVSLPDGTKDIIVGEEVYGSTRLWILKSGQKVVKSSSVLDYNVNEFPLSVITNAAVNNSGKYTEVTFEGAKNTVYKAGFKDLYAPSTSNFNTSFNVNQFEFTVFNTHSAPNIELSNSLFSSVQKEMVDSTTFKYTFNMTNTGKFYGYKVYFNSNGDLTVKFRNPIVLSGVEGKPLTGIKIMLDPGHGGIHSGAVVSGVKEKDINLLIANYLKPMLADLGANVIMTREGDTTLELGTILEKEWAEEPDIFISIHNNSSGSSTHRGALSLYFYGYSSNLANNIQNKLLNNYGSNKFISDCRYQNLRVLRNQQIVGALIEVGFMSNAQELQNLCDPQYQIKSARAIADGIIQSYSY